MLLAGMIRLSSREETAQNWNMSQACNSEAAASLDGHQRACMAASQTFHRIRAEKFDRILEPSPQRLAPVREATIYPAQFPVLLRERLQGKSIAEVAEYLGIPPKDVNRLLAGQWRPTKGICKKMGLKVVYALTEQPGAGIS